MQMHPILLCADSQSCSGANWRPLFSFSVDHQKKFDIVPRLKNGQTQAVGIGSLSLPRPAIRSVRRDLLNWQGINSVLSPSTSRENRVMSEPVLTRTNHKHSVLSESRSLPALGLERCSLRSELHEIAPRVCSIYFHFLLNFKHYRALFAPEMVSWQVQHGAINVLRLTCSTRELVP